jgi:putative proteasome-type protease
MTYCVGLYLREGLVMLADTRTNAGVDHVSTFSKMHLFAAPGERFVALLSAGNLAITQAVVNLLHEGFTVDGQAMALATAENILGVAKLVGQAIREVHRVDGPALEAESIPFDVSFLLGGQIGHEPARLFQIYSAGNFIEATADTPFLQIGEHKYGKPILDRACSFETALYDGVKLVLVSMDSTLRSNLSVGMPIDLLVYRAGALKLELKRRITEHDGYFRMIQERWSAALREAYRAIPQPEWK